VTFCNGGIKSIREKVSNVPELDILHGLPRQRGQLVCIGHLDGGSVERGIARLVVGVGGLDARRHCYMHIFCHGQSVRLQTTATAHANAVVIKRFVQDNIIYRAATEWASYLYKTKDQLGQQVEVYDNSLRIAQGISPTVYHALHKRQRVVVSSAS
jgi:hypothetical protein